MTEPSKAAEYCLRPFHARLATSPDWRRASALEMSSATSTQSVAQQNGKNHAVVRRSAYRQREAMKKAVNRLRGAIATTTTANSSTNSNNRSTSKSASVVTKMSLSQTNYRHNVKTDVDKGLSNKTLHEDSKINETQNKTRFKTEYAFY